MRLNMDWEILLDQVESRPYITTGNMQAALQFSRDVKVSEQFILYNFLISNSMCYNIYIFQISWIPFQRLPNGNLGIFYSYCPIFDMSIINLHKSKLSPKQLGIEKVNSGVILPLRIKQKSKLGAANWNFRSKYDKKIQFWNDNRYISVVQRTGGQICYTYLLFLLLLLLLFLVITSMLYFSCPPSPTSSPATPFPAAE